MRKILFIASLFISFSAFSQSEENGGNITLNVPYSKTQTNLVLSSSELTSFLAYDNSSSIWVTVYTYNNSTNKMAPGFQIYGGWGYYGNCVVYGTFYVGSNNVTMFVPCGFGCTGFPSICPEAGNGIARLVFKQEIH